uniref:Uncharacterized protein n=1 Tax=Rhodochaete parvula TaxID=110510 RepID=A0A220T0C6_9RHOD|nr:hypothetical protein Rhodc_014 [Rhodochaete parvula]
MTYNYDKQDTSSLESNEIELYHLNETRPIGWSVLDETFFYYLDCNYVNMCNLDNNRLEKEC